MLDPSIAPPADEPDLKDRVPVPGLTAQLIAGYTATHYRVLCDRPITLRVGQPAPGGWLEALGCRSASVVTAWNPFSEQLPADENKARQQELTAAVEAAGLRWLSAVGQDPAGQWPAEQSACVLDAPLVLVNAWLARFGQFAAVLVETGDCCRLVWHPEVRGSGARSTLLEPRGC